MIVNLILRSDNCVARGLTYAITLATPFYGYPGQVHRWFEGEPILNGPDADHRDEMMRIICSLPALYVLHSPDLEETWPRDKQALAEDEYPLDKYPTLDKQTCQPLDPWTQATGPNGRMRYPVARGFMEDDLCNAKRVYQRLARPLNDDRFYNIRGVAKTLIGNQPSESSTPSTVTQDWISSSFDPDHERPIRDHRKCAGDDVHPAWTARLASIPPARCKTVIAKGIDHMCITSHRDFLTQLGEIVFDGGKFELGDEISLPDMATNREAEEFLAWVRGYIDGYKATRRTRASDKALENAMREKYGARLGSLWRWILEHVFKIPSGTYS